MDADSRDRVFNLIDFLAAYDARRNPPVHDISKYQLFLRRDSDFPKVPAVRLTPTGENWVTVDPVEIPAAPAIPDEFAEVLLPEPGDAWPTVALPEDPSEEMLSLAKGAEAWLDDEWAPWAAAHSEALIARSLYRNLFEVRERLDVDRDTLEFVWGFGRLRWSPSRDVVVDHPMFTIPIEVELDEKTRRLHIRPSGAVEIEASYLSDLSVADRPGLNAMRNEVAEVDALIDPWAQQEMEERFRGLVRCIDHNGVLSEEVRSTFTVATGNSSWVIYLRRRRPDYQGFLEDLRELYRAGVDPPDPIQALVIDAPSSLVGDDIDDDDQHSIDDEPLLLPLATNEEQQRILTHAKRRAGVTVQGPPGTGKSHTIANIISHYVAYGKKVLVVAEKEQALRVLADKIPEGIRDLTVSVLGADEDGRRRLGSSIHQIQTRVTAVNRKEADREIERLTTELDAVDRRIAETTNRLLSTRSSETEHLSGNWQVGDNPTPMEAAAWLTLNEARFGYVDDVVGQLMEMPIDSGELSELASLVERIGADRAMACAFVLPDLERIPIGSELEVLFSDLDAVTEELTDARPEITNWSVIDDSPIEDIAKLCSGLANEYAWWAKASNTWLDRVRIQLGDPLVATSLNEFLENMRVGRERAFEIGRNLQAHDVAVPTNPGPTLRQVLVAAKERLDQKGKFGLFAGDTKRALADCTIDGRPVVSAGEIQLCISELDRAETRRLITTRWTNGISIVSGPAVEETAPEVALGPLLDDFECAMSWNKRRDELIGELTKLQIAVPQEFGVAELARFHRLSELAVRRHEERALSTRVATLHIYLTSGAQSESASPIWRLLADALYSRRLDNWDTHRAEVASLEEIAPSALRLRLLYERLSTAAPIWANRILSDPLAAGVPADSPGAWEWRQLESWIATVKATGRPDVLQHELEELSRSRRRVVEELVSERAWRRLADNLGDAQRLALNSYLTAVGRFGKTGGKFAARWLSEMRKALNESKDAVPVWIMPTNRALTNFRPSAVPPFDVLVIDEASQLGLHTIPLLSLAKRTIVVGDDKQTSPENVGLNLEPVFDLMDQYLAKIPKYRTLFNPDNSLYDIAFQKFPDVVMLTEHFRCLPEIIQFSNVHSYNGHIVPLRDQPPRPGWKALGALKVLDGYRQGQRNRPEAEAIADLVERLCNDPDYAGMSFGVVSLLGVTQSKLIWELIYDRLGPKAMDERSIRCGEPANFQGDERDVMVLSLVVATDPANPTGRFGAMTDRASERRINVAASRARNQMWVVHSVDPERFSQSDLRADLIRHAQNPGTLTEDLQNLESRCESDFERLVLRRIVAKGYRRLRVAHPVGRFRIDLVVEGPHARLAVECDGDQWHGEERWHQDRARQAVLERAGWTFERIRGSDFYRNPEEALMSLWSRLEERGIPTGDEWLTQREQSTVLEVTGTATSDDDTSEDSGIFAPDESALAVTGSPSISESHRLSVHFGARSYGPSVAEVREWSRSRGLPVGDRGRLHPDIIQAWNDGHPDRQYEPLSK